MESNIEPYSFYPGDKITNPILLSSVANQTFKIELFKGRIQLENRKSRCFIRKITCENYELLALIAMKEIAIINFVQSLSDYFVELLTYYHHKNEYFLIYRRYGRNLSMIQGKEERYELVKQIIQGILCLHGNDRFHGALSPENIYIDKCNKIKIGNLFHADFKHNES